MTFRPRFLPPRRRVQDPARGNRRRGAGLLTGGATAESPKSGTGAPPKRPMRTPADAVSLCEDGVRFVWPDTWRREYPGRRSGHPSPERFKRIFPPHPPLYSPNPEICSTNNFQNTRSTKMCDSDKFSLSKRSKLRISRFFHLPLSAHVPCGHTASGRNFQHDIYHIRSKNISNPVYLESGYDNKPSMLKKLHIQTNPYQSTCT